MQIKKKYYSILFIFFLILFFIYFNNKVCNFDRLFISSKNFGLIYSIKHCKNIFSNSMKKTFKSILVNTPLEIHARAFTDSGNYEKINANSVVKIREKKKN